MWFLRSALLPSLRLSLLRRLPVHGWLLVALGRRRVLAGLLRRRVWVVSVAVLRKRLAVRAVQLWCTLRRILATPDGVRGDEGLRLGGDGGEDAFLREAGAVGAAAVF